MTVAQDDFVSALLRPDADVPLGLSDPEGRPAGKRFDVYRNNVAVSLTEALRTAFPIVRKLLGDQNFDAISGVYLRQHPPKSPLLMFYGEDMPQFLASFPPVQKWGYLPDVARLELALRRAYHAEDAGPIDPGALQAIAPDALVATRVALAPAACVIRSPWPVHGIWQFNMQDGAPQPANRAEDVLVARPGFDPAIYLLPMGGGAFVDALSAGEPIGVAYDAALTKTAEFDLPNTLGTLLAAEAITALETPE